MNCGGDCFHQGCEGPYGYYTRRGCDWFHSYARQKSCYCIPWPCPNFKMCGEIAPFWLLDCHGGFCNLGCNLLGQVVSKDNVENDECPVCSEVPPHFIKFPACDHYFCKDCTRKIWMGLGEIHYHLSPVPFGCPPCPNGCDNPIRGVQCGCHEFWSADDKKADEPLGVRNKWEIEHPDQFEAFNEADEQLFWTPDPNYGTQKCPLCRQTGNNNSGRCILRTS